jgi:lysozyme family protein
MASDFDAAFNHGMLYEVGPWYNPTDKDTIAGLWSTKEQQRKVGYCNIVGDKGGETKFGVAQNYNKNINVKTLTLEGAKTVYRDAYWKPSRCSDITIPIHLFYFDMVINMGLGRAAKILQEAVGVKADGAIGNITLTAVNKTINARGLIETMAKIREQRYRAIVASDPTQQKFLNGWLRRNAEVKQAALELV